jgi:hypothetical protein
MKKGMLIWLVLLLGSSYPSFAKDGMAYDEIEFVLAIVGFLLIVVGLIEGIDYLKKNGKGLLIRFRTILRNKMLTPKNSH